MVVVTLEVCLDRGVTVEWRKPGLVLKTSPNVKHATGSTQLASGDIREEVIQAVEVDVDRRVSSDVAEVLRSVVVPDIAGVFRTFVSWLCVVSLLVPAPFDRRLIQLCEVRDIILQIGQVSRRVQILLTEQLERTAREGERQAGECQVKLGAFGVIARIDRLFG